MFVVTVNGVPGYEVQAVHGLASGSEVRAKDMFRDIGASLKGLIGGELRSYSALMVEARNAALAKMVGSAEAMGANAVVGVRMTAGQIARSAAEVYAYGTAVTVVKAPPIRDRDTSAAEPDPVDPTDAASEDPSELDAADAEPPDSADEDAAATD